MRATRALSPGCSNIVKKTSSAGGTPSCTSNGSKESLPTARPLPTQLTLFASGAAAAARCSPKWSGNLDWGVITAACLLCNVLLPVWIPMVTARSQRLVRHRRELGWVGLGWVGLAWRAVTQVKDGWLGEWV